MRLHSLGLALSIIAVLVIAGVAISMNNTKSDIRQALNVTITSPSSGEVFQGNAPCSIKYAIIGGAPDYTVKLYYTVNQTFIFINYCNTSVEGAQQYNWITPLLTNLTVRIKIDVNTTSEEAYNLSGEFEIDSTPPSKPKPELPAHDSIAVEGYPRAREIKLKWSASGDDGDIGKASYYHARCYDNPINETNWDDIPQYWRINYSAVAYPGGYESCIFKNLEPDKIYYFAVKAYDNVGLSSGLSTCISIRTLKYEAWPDSITGAGVQWDPVNKTLYFIDSRTVTYTEVLMKGNLRVVNNAELKFNKVLFVMDCFEDWEYRIEVAPGGLVGYLEGGKFLLEYSNISTNVAIMPDGTERWHPYLFVAYRNARFWMLYSSMRHCGSKPEDIKNIKLSAVQIDAEVDVELGIEIRSSDVFIENSIITQNWGVFIRPSLPMQASPGIRNNIISHNRYGIVIKPRIDITEQWPINLIVNNFTNNGIGLYSDNARVGLEGCLFINNFYGTIYNNTPLDYPHNVSGVIYRSIFTFNKYAIAARNSSLKAISTIFINNTHINNTDFEASNFHSTVHLEDSYAEFKQCKFANNTYLELKLINISDPLISTIYCKGSTLNIANCSFYSNNGIDFDKADIWNYVAPGNPISTLLEGLTSTIHYELSNITIDSSNFTDNGYPFSANESFYNLNFAGHLNFTGYTERIPIKERVSGLAPVLDIEASKLGMPIHYSMISGYGYSPISTFLNITSNKFYGNLQGIFSFGPAITLKGNNITFTPWEGHLGSVSYPPVPSHYEGTINYFLICGNSPLTVQYNNISEYCIGIMWLFAEANFTGNNFTHNYFATVALGTAEIPDVITVGLRTLSREFKIALPPVISKLLDTLEKVNVVAGFVNNNYTNNLCSLVTLGGYQITLQYNYFDGMEGTQWFLTFIQTFFIYSNVTISNCTFAEHGGVEGPGFGYQIYAGSSTLHVSDSFIGDTLLGLLGYYCQMQIYNTTLKSLWALVVIGKAASAEVRNSDLYGGSYNDMGAACEASGGATLNLSNVNILAGDDGVWLGIGATLNIQYSKIANTFDGIESEQVSESTVSISSTSIFDIPGTGIKVYDANVDITESVFGECAAGINYQSTSAGKGLNLRDSEFKEIPGTVVLVSGTAANYARIAIENNTFSNCGECIVPTYVTGKIMYNEISASTLGARIENSELEVTNNHFVSVSTGAWARFLNSKTRIYNNTFYTCSIGIETEDSSCIVTENKIYSSFRGLWLKGGAPKIANNTISYSLFGIYIAEWSGTEPRVVDNILINNYCGLHVEKLVKGLYTRNNIISFNCYGIRINRSSPSITLELQGDMIFNNSEYGIHMMAVQAYIEPLQKITATNLTICNNPVGIALRACEPTFSNSSITNNTYDALLSESATLKFINTSIGCVNITDTTSKLEVYVYLTASVKWQTGAGVENATVAIYDKYDVEVFRGLTDRNGVCTAELLTNYINHSADRGYSPYTINASISVIFSKTELVIAKTKLLTVWTAAGSREVKYVATFMERCELILYDLTLPTISVEPPLFAITNSATLKISGTAWDNMGLYNWTVDKGASAFWVRVNKGAWNALKPDCRMLKFEVVGGRIINSTIEWSGIVNLVEGENWIELRVADETYDLINGTGNTAIANLSAIMGMPITLDTTPPVITEIIVEYSSYNKTYNLTNASAEFINSTQVNLKLSIKGENSENVTIWVNLDNYLIRLNSTGEAWLKTDNITLTLGYNAITIIVSDELGNRFSYSIKLLVADQLAPASLITYPFKDHVNSILEVAGFAQDDISGVATVYIRIYNKSGNTNWWKDKWITKESWLEVELKGERYEKWSLNTAGVKWLDGCEYWIYTKASDRANNTEKEHYKIFTYDTTKPFIDIPIQDGYRTAENYLKISGRTESGASIVVNGMSVAVDELGSFSLELKLGEGSNIITIVACDTAGNINELTITIEKYTEVPLITPALIMLIWIVAGTLLAGIIAVIIATSVKIKPRIKAPKAKLLTVPAVPKEEQPVPERRYF